MLWKLVRLAILLVVVAIAAMIWWPIAAVIVIGDFLLRAVRDYDDHQRNRWRDDYYRE